MKLVIVTGACGLVGSNLCFFLKKGFRVIGIDNNFRKLFLEKMVIFLGQKNFLKKKITFIII